MQGAGSAPIVIPDDYRPFDLNDFAMPQHYLDSGEVASIMLPSGLIIDRVDKMAQDIIEVAIRGAQDGGQHEAGDSEGRPPSPPPHAPGVTHCDKPQVPKELHLLCVLKGASRFFHDLLAALRRRTQASSYPLKLQFEYVKVSSYSGTQSTGTVRIEGMHGEALKGKEVIVCEDIVDSGQTLRRVVPFLKTFGPATVRVATLLKKRVEPKGLPASGPDPLVLDFVGFSIPDKFIIGYHLDYNEQYRDLEHLCVISQKGIEVHQQSIEEKDM